MANTSQYGVGMNIAQTTSMGMLVHGSRFLWGKSGQASVERGTAPSTSPLVNRSTPHANES
jgi:hypothetical protein